MAFEKQIPAVEPRLLTADGGTLGQVQVANTRGLKVGSKAVLVAVGQNDLAVQVKRVMSENLLLVGPLKSPYSKAEWTDVSAYTVAAGAYIYAEQQDKAKVPPNDREEAVFDQEPTIAWRNVLVDQLGRYYETANPLPVRLTDGSINIGTVNAEIEVHLSAFADLAGEYDSIRIADDENELDINPDGSINANIVNSAVLNPAIENIIVANADEELSFTFPDKTRKMLMRVRDGMAKTQIAWSVGETDTAFLTINMGANYSEETNLSNKTVYFRLNKPNKIIELLYWVQI